MSTGFLSKSRLWRKQKAIVRPEQRNDLYHLHKIHSIDRCLSEPKVSSLVQDTGSKGWSTGDLINFEIPSFSDSTEEARRVRFDNCDTVMLIPTVDDYKKKGFRDVLWYHKMDLDDMKDVAVQEIKHMMLNGNCRTVRCAMNALYQPASFSSVTIDVDHLEIESPPLKSLSPLSDNGDPGLPQFVDDSSIDLQPRFDLIVQGNPEKDAQFFLTFDEEETNSSITLQEVYQTPDSDDDNTLPILNKTESNRRPSIPSRSSGFLPHIEEEREAVNGYGTETSSTEDPCNNLLQRASKGINLMPDLQPNLGMLISSSF